jgi:coiled-coil domain-containing protein 55
MNISISAPGKKKKGPSGYGLNERKDNDKSGNVFGDDGDDDDGDSYPLPGGTNNRKAVNQQIAMEQDALRRRAQASLKSVEDPSVYDYDGAYDSFKNTNPDDSTNPNGRHNDGQSKGERKSKYIGDLLKAAKSRERERDAIYERKIAREQAEEDIKEEYAGKEKFVTKAYKRKLEERKLWEQEQEEKEREEAANDVTKKSAGAAFASFYGNLNKNVSAGGTKEVIADAKEKTMGIIVESLDDFDPRRDFLGGFERSTAGDGGDQEQEQIRNNASGTSSSSKDVVMHEQQKEPQLSLRERREKKVAEARIRYLKRKEVTIGQ